MGYVGSDAYKERRRQYREKNREELNRKAREKYRKNPEIQKENTRKYLEKHPGAGRETRKKYYAMHKDEIIAAQKKERAENHERVIEIEKLSRAKHSIKSTAKSYFRKMGIHPKDIPPELLEVKIIHVKLNREIKGKKENANEN